MIFVWSGWGFLVPIFIAVSLLAVNGLGRFIDPMSNLTNSLWMLPVALLVSALLCCIFSYLFPAKTTEHIDHRTGTHVFVRRRDSFFFIPMKYWTWILTGLAIGVFIFFLIFGEKSFSASST
jgi:hypothetical protein